MDKLETTPFRPRWHGNYRPGTEPTKMPLTLRVTALCFCAGLYLVFWELPKVLLKRFRKVEPSPKWLGALEAWMGSRGLDDSGEIITSPSSSNDGPSRRKNIWFYFEIPSGCSARLVGLSDEGAAGFYTWDHQTSTSDFSYVCGLPSFTSRAELFELLDQVLKGELVPDEFHSRQEPQ